MRAALRGVCSPRRRPPPPPFSFNLLSFICRRFPPPWSLKAIIISLQRCHNPALHLYLEEPYRDEWNLSADRDEWLPLRPALNFLIPRRLSLNKRPISLHFKSSLICCRRLPPPPACDILRRVAPFFKT